MSKVGKKILVGSLVAALLSGALMFGVASYIVNDMAIRAWSYEATNAVNEGIKKYNGDLRTTIKNRSQYILEEEGKEHKSRLKVYDKRGNTVADNFGTNLKKEEPDKVLKDVLLGDKVSFIKVEDKEIRTIIPIKNNTVVIGALERYYNIEPIIKVRDTNITYLFIFSVLASLLGGFLGLIINRGMIENVENLKRSAIKVGDSELAIMEKSIDIKENKKRRFDKNKKADNKKEATNKKEIIDEKLKEESNSSKDKKRIKDSEKTEDISEIKESDEIKSRDENLSGKINDKAKLDDKITDKVDKKDEIHKRDDENINSKQSNSLKNNENKSIFLKKDEDSKDIINENTNITKNTQETVGGIRRNQFMFSTIDVNIVELFYEIGEMYASKAYEKGVDFIFETENEDIIVEADINSLRQALMNIVDNAVKFSFRGGLINIEIMDMSLNEVEIKVRDNGVGISTEDITKIFNEHYSSGENAGMGLGLTYSKEIIKGHGGEILVNSIEGEGTEVIIHLIKSSRDSEKFKEKQDERNEIKKIGENNNVAKTSNESNDVKPEDTSQFPLGNEDIKESE